MDLICIPIDEVKDILHTLESVERDSNTKRCIAILTERLA